MSRFDYVQYDEQAAALQAEIKQKFVDLEASIYKLNNVNVTERALISLEEAYMWCGKAIKSDQLARNGSVDLKEDRCNS